MLAEAVDGLNVRPDGVYVDVTFGGGGHSRAIMERLGPEGHLYAFDQDEDAAVRVKNGEWKVESDGQFTFIGENFRYLKSHLRLHGVRRIDGLLADLGVSSHQFDVAERGRCSPSRWTRISASRASSTCAWTAAEPPRAATW